MAGTYCIDNEKITKKSGTWIEWAYVRDHEQIKGNGSPFYSLDNVFQLTGNS